MISDTSIPVVAGATVEVPQTDALIFGDFDRFDPLFELLSW